MMSTTVLLLASWLGLNAAFVAVRLYLTSDDGTPAADNLIRFPRLVD
jgi:hypothetical protein